MRARGSLLVVWSAALALAGAALARLVPVVRDQLRAPFDLISEGPHMCTVKALWAGFDIYARGSFLDLPFFMTPYTPLYHALVAVLPQDPANPFFTGRLVAAGAMGIAAAALPAIAARGHRATAVLALGVFFLIHAVTGNTAYLRSDAMALAFSVWAVVAAARARTRVGVIASAVLAALGVAAKQSFLAAGVACFIHVARHRPRDLGAFLGAGLAVGAVLGAAATAWFGTDFWFAVTLPLSDYPRDIESYWVHWDMMLAQPLVRFVLGAGAGATIVALVRDGRRACATPYLPYAGAAWILQNGVMTGIGAENHNLIEPMLATLVWIVVVAQGDGTPLRLGWARAAGLTVLAWCVVLELGNPNTRLWSHTDPAHTARYVRERASARDALRALDAEHGRLLNLKNSQIPHDFEGGEMNLNDLWMYITVLWNSRPETVGRLLAAIEAERFDAVIVSPGVVRVDPNPGDAPWPRISRALFERYRVAYHGGEVNLLTRRNARE
ncbi:MAG: hypothetical protein IT293_03190 [Deltaproteobacteria bacterium]|nr:hypothetical protein [Deltaproteobacteria bacterium]